MLQFSNLTVETAVAKSGAMEADTISKNGRSSKSQTSSGNKFFIIVVLVFVSLSSFGQRYFYFDTEVTTGQSKENVKYTISILEDNSTISFDNLETDIAYAMRCEHIPYTGKGGSIDKYLYYKGYIYQKYNHKTKVKTPFNGTSSRVEISMTPPIYGRITMWITLLGQTRAFGGYEIKN